MQLRILGTPVRIEPIFFLVAALLAASRLSEPWFLASWVAVVLGSVLLHELGHALAFRRYGYAPSIRLHAMGGHTTANAPLTWKQDMVVSLAGPLLGLAIGGLVYAAGWFFPALHSTPFLSVVVSDLVWVNIGWSIVNLLPILPMDGGRVLLAGLRRFDPSRASALAHRVSMVAAGAAAIAAMFARMPFAAILGVMFAVDTYRAIHSAR
jgi:stage IV sporulation protein FB